MNWEGTETELGRNWEGTERPKSFSKITEKLKDLSPFQTKRMNV